MHTASDIFPITHIHYEEDRYSPIGNIRVNYTYEGVYFQGTYLARDLRISVVLSPTFSVL